MPRANLMYLENGPPYAANSQGEVMNKIVDALERIYNWTQAYPVSVFHEPTKEEWAKANAALKANDLSLDAISASNMRHVITQVGKDVEEALPLARAQAEELERLRDALLNISDLSSGLRLALYSKNQLADELAKIYDITEKTRKETKE